MRLKVSSEELLNALVNKGWSVTQAALEMGISVARMGKYLKADRGVYPQTAAKMRRLFGEKVIYLTGEKE